MLINEDLEDGAIVLDVAADANLMPLTVCEATVFIAENVRREKTVKDLERTSKLNTFFVSKFA